VVSSRCSSLMRAARSPDRTQTTAGAISHRRPDRTYSTPSWCEPDRRPSARPIRRCGLPAAERSVATDRPVRATIVVDRCGVLSRDTALAVLASALCVSRVARPASAGGVAPPLDVDQFGDLGSNHFHRVLRRVQPVSGAEQGADLPDLFVGRPVHDGDQLVACQKLRELLVRAPRLSTRSSNAGVMRTRPARDLARPLSISRING